MQITRRFFMGGAAVAMASGAFVRAFGQNQDGMRLLSKEVLIPSENGTGVFPGFTTYVHPTEPILLHRFGWVDASDTYDNFHDRFSRDNGRTWSEPVLKLASHAVEGGRVRYIENGAYFDAERGKLITVVSKMLYPNDQIDVEQPRQLEIAHYNPLAGDDPSPRTLDFGLPGGMSVSFCFPIKTSSGRIIIPGFKTQMDEAGKVVHHPQSGMVVYEVRMVLGEYREDGTLDWRVGEPLRTSFEQSSRGLSESSPVELQDGRITLVCRGSNAKMTDAPGRKWLSFSEDGGEHWAAPAPLGYDDGELVESSATGCACFRSLRNGRLYFIGNLCVPGVHADGNWPRAPLHIAEMTEEPFAIRRETVTVVDNRDADDSTQTQISNFRYYQDRETGDIVITASRFGENDAKEWKRADHYWYRVALG